MHDRVKKVSPRAFTQAKLLDNTLVYRTIGAGVDPELICNITDIAGNDCWSLWPGGDYAYSWLQMELWYDLLHSFRGQPVANTENHILPDGTTVGDDFPPAHTYAVYWQGALHHQGAQATWVWEEPVDPGLEGHISLRPANIHAGAKAMLDLNRLAEEITAVNRAKPQAAILYSVPSIFWEKDLEETTKKAYAALNFLGLTITFVSERQLAGGKAPVTDYLVLPHTTHVLDSTVAALERFVKKGGKLVLLGQENLTRDEYHCARPLPAALAKIEPTDVRGLPDVLKALPRMTLVNAGTGQPAWGVEFRTVHCGDHWLVPMINLLPKAQTVKLSARERPLIWSPAKPSTPHNLRWRRCSACFSAFGPILDGEGAGKWCRKPAYLAIRLLSPVILAPEKQKKLAPFVHFFLFSFDRWLHLWYKTCAGVVHENCNLYAITK